MSNFSDTASVTSVTSATSNLSTSSKKRNNRRGSNPRRTPSSSNKSGEKKTPGNKIPLAAKPQRRQSDALISNMFTSQTTDSSFFESDTYVQQMIRGRKPLVHGLAM